MKTKLPVLLLSLLFLGLASTTAANGWGSGLNFVPVIEETLATDETGNQMTLNSGTPVYLKPTDGVLDTWIRWEERPSERRVQIPRTALPQRLEGFRAYQRREFRRSTLLLESEAAAETHPLVRSWKYILAGHSHLLSDSADYAGAIRLYRLVAQNPSNAFRADAQHLVVRALLNQKQYEEAREALVTLSRLLKDAPFHGGVLFSTYPLHSPVTAWVMGRRGGVEESLEALDAFMDAKKAFASRDDAREDSEDAEICYQLALATEGLWRVFPERFFDNTRAWHVPPLLELTFKDYPATEGAAKAYYHWLDYQQYWDFDGEQIEWERQQKELMERFLARYPDSTPAPQARKRLEQALKHIAELAERSTDLKNEADVEATQRADGEIAAPRATGGTTKPLKVKLFYRDYTKDPSSRSHEADGYIEKEIPGTATPLRDTIELLLTNRLTDAERESGLSSEFDGPEYAERRSKFRLVDVSIQGHTAILVFEDPGFFTHGGSWRVGIMKSQITKTALQFQEVLDVEIRPDDLFQP